MKSFESTDRKKQYHLVQIPSYLFWIFMIIWTFSITLQSAAEVIRWMQPETDATQQCREVVKGSIAWDLRDGILCVRPVHFIERG